MMTDKLSMVVSVVVNSFSQHWTKTMANNGTIRAAGAKICSQEVQDRIKASYLGNSQCRYRLGEFLKNCRPRKDARAQEKLRSERTHSLTRSTAQGMPQRTLSPRAQPT